MDESEASTRVCVGIHQQAERLARLYWDSADARVFVWPIVDVLGRSAWTAETFGVPDRDSVYGTGATVRDALRALMAALRHKVEARIERDLRGLDASKAGEDADE